MKNDINQSISDKILGFERMANDVASLTQEEISDFINGNNLIISNINKISFSLIKKQYYLTQKLHFAGKISAVDYDVFFYFYKRAKIRSDIDDYTTALRAKEYSEVVISIIIEQLKKYCEEGLILTLDEKYLKKLNSLMRLIQIIVNKSLSLRKSVLLLGINDLIDNFLSINTGYSNIVARQNIEILLKPINSSFSVDKIDFTADLNKKNFENGCLRLTNNHIVSLDINEKLYGVEGKLSFQLAHPLNHPDFAFLASKKQLVAIDIKLSEVYNFSEDSQSENHTRETRFYVVGNINNDADVSRQVLSNVYGEESIYGSMQNYTIQFEDPLKVFWKLHKPCYIDFKKTVEDLLQDNFFFDSMIELNCSSSALQEGFDQVFLSTVGRSFYDFFIEQLYINNCILKYYIGPEDEKVSYFISDSVDSVKSGIKNSQDNVEQEFKLYDMAASIKQKLIAKSADCYAEKSLLIPDINYTDEKVKNFDYNGAGDPFNNIGQTVIGDVNYLKQPDEISNQSFGDSHDIEVETRAPLPYVNAEIDLSTISSNKFLLGIDDEDVMLWRRKISYRRINYLDKKLQEHIAKTKYESDSDSDSFEKIAVFPSLPLTHQSNIKYVFRHAEHAHHEYPSFKAFNSFDFIGRISIGDDVEEDEKKAYKFFKDFDDDETCLEDVQDDEEQGEELVFNSKRDIFYAVEIFEDLLSPGCSEDPLIYIPVRININSAINEFMPLRHEDMVKLSVYSLTECSVCEIISNTAISLEKTDEVILQRQLLGAKENCEIAYSQEGEKETYSITQQNEDNDNSILINNVEGIFFTYKAKDD